MVPALTGIDRAFDGGEAFGDVRQGVQAVHVTWRQFQREEDDVERRPLRGERQRGDLCLVDSGRAGCKRHDARHQAVAAAVVGQFRRADDAVRQIRRQLFLDPHSCHPAQHDVAPAFCEGHVLHDVTQADHRMHRGIRLIARRVARQWHRHRHRAVTLHGVRDHPPVARLEDVEGEQDAREQRDCLEREDREGVGMRHR